ncbi:Putative Holin-X, holin superfamily III [Corynebacterium pollutisoli]|uniref:Putative Holin-X, holin superfamily III n=1 Tax=Corynebacterium pollutisoli TaxID=1610489 RepID=A0A1X7HW95_9CORY|nr:phage holin family protein [Corynebacterium pollutisoli]SMG05689.1 Putative Holin-X, holin superfamily III [Corynebacterium pollutisoli]
MTEPTPRVTHHAASRAEVPRSEAEVRARTESLGEMFASFSRNLSDLMRQEVQLAKAEAAQSARQGGRGAGMLAGAAVGGFLALLFLSLALMWALGAVMHLGFAAVIVALIWAAVAAALAMSGKKQLENMKGLPQTQDTIGDIPPTLNPNKETP